MGYIELILLYLKDILYFFKDVITFLGSLLASVVTIYLGYLTLENCNNKLNITS